MAVPHKSLITKGVFAVSIVATTAVIGLVGFAKADTSSTGGNGYGTGSQAALAAADTFQSGYNTDASNFFNQVTGVIVPQAQNTLTNEGAADASSFSSEFQDASNRYSQSVNTAADTFRTAITNAQNTAVSKDDFINAFNQAKANYFNSLEGYKNTFADELNHLGGNDVAKDQFMNSYNSAKDAYGNQLEQLKNNFAASLG